MQLPDFDQQQRHRIAEIAESYERLTARQLVPHSHGKLIEALWEAPLAIVAHGTETPPIFFFGNRTALTLFEMDPAAFTTLPSHLSAEPMRREERADLLARVTRDGLIDNYAGVRISSTGKRFHIANASVWNVTDKAGHPLGQAAAFADWTYQT